MQPEAISATVKLLRRAPLLPENSGVSVDFTRDDVKNILPHRDPFLFVDTIDVYNQVDGTVRGRRNIHAEDPIFKGHFPATPIYPGVLVIEAIGQLALTMVYFNLHGAVRPTTPFSMQVRATRIHHAVFYAPFVPDDTMTLHARQIESDFTMIAIGQAWRGDVLAACAIMEVHIDD